MRNLFIALLTVLSICSKAQDNYTKEIDMISQSLNQQLSGNSIKKKVTDSLDYKVALVSIENEDGKSTKLTELLENEIAVELTLGSHDNYIVLDRNNIDKLLAEKNIPKTFGNKRDFAKNLGRIKAADIMVAGVLYNFDTEYRLIFTILETKEGEMISGARGKITATSLLKEKNGQASIINQPSTQVDVALRKDKQEPTNSSYSDKPDDMDPNCASKDIGNLYVDNKTSNTILITFGKGNNPWSTSEANLTLGPNQADKIRGIKTGVYTYAVNIKEEGGSIQWNFRTGSVQILQCKQQNLVIK